MTIGTKINWAGDYANSARAGVVTAVNNGMVSICWNDGATLSVPEFTIVGAKWKVGG